MAHKARKDHYLKDLFCQENDDKSMYPSCLSDITDNFSKKAEIGSGGFGVVYKGVLQDGFVAVKKFKEAIDDKAFLDEVNCLIKIEHPNIVKYIGYCAGSEKYMAMNEGKNILAESPYQLICFEYLRKGSLDMHLNDQPCGLPWQVCYKIIQGICLGLHHLHEHRIIHRDIKPGNILLDDHMTPKIADFGLSRFLGDGKSRINTGQVGTLGYMAPESMFHGIFTFKSDIYSLGVIIRKIVIGNGTTSKEETLYEWGQRSNLDASQRPTPLDQVKECIDISVGCTDIDKAAENRPDMRDILRRLGITETSGCSAAGGISTSPAPSSSTGKEPKVETEPSMAAAAKRPGDTSPERLEGTTDARPKMLPSRSLQIANNRSRFWRWLSVPDCRFGECAELLSVYLLAVTGEIPPRELSAGTSYDVHLVYKLASKTIGLRGSIQTASLRLHGKQVLATNKVCLEPKAHGMGDDVMCPIERGDGWLELRLAEFVNDDKMLTEEGVIVDLREEDTTIKKSGLIMAGMEFRSK